jgi:hypothetical protein
VPELDRCQIYNPSLVDPLLKPTYRKIPRLARYSNNPFFIIFLISFLIRMADYAPAWGPHSKDGGFQFSEVLPYYESPDVE